MTTATPSEAHAEWHLNAGVPMGMPGCPWDACHLPDPDPEVSMACGYCHDRHWGYDRAEVLDSIRGCAREDELRRVESKRAT